jgi:hypothetical protein
MAEKVAKLSVSREKDFMYYVKDGAVWKVKRKQPGVQKGKPEKVVDGNFEMDTDFIYFVDRDGDVARAKRAVGGQKRKKKPAARKPARGKPAAKAAKAKKPAAKPAKGKATAKAKKVAKAKPARGKAPAKKKGRR